MRHAARRVLYRSRKARLARIVAGCVFAILTFWLIAPVLATDHGASPPVILVLGDDMNLYATSRGKVHTAPDVVDLRTRLKGCHNPATIEGTLLISTNTWYVSKAIGSRGPDQMMLAIKGARVRSVVMGLEGFGPSYKHPIVGRGSIEGLFGKKLVVHNSTLPLQRVGQTSVAVLDSPQWPRAATPVHFSISADIVRSAGFDSCYVVTPQLYSSVVGRYRVSAFADASEAIERISKKLGPLMPEDEPPLYQLENGKTETGPTVKPIELGAAEALVHVSGYEVDLGTAGPGGEATGEGLRYLCHSAIERPPPVRGLDSRISPDFTNEATNPTCAAAPRFVKAQQLSDSTRRLFAAGITGALGATLIVEAMFLGETESPR